MSDYTPTTDEILRGYRIGRVIDERTGDRELVLIKREERTRWLEQQRAQAKAEALREAAEAFSKELGSNAANPGPKYVVGWLHNRAAKLGAK